MVCRQPVTEYLLQIMLAPWLSYWGSLCLYVEQGWMPNRLGPTFHLLRRDATIAGKFDIVMFVFGVMAEPQFTLPSTPHPQKGMRNLQVLIPAVGLRGTQEGSHTPTLKYQPFGFWRRPSRQAWDKLELRDTFIPLTGFSRCLEGSGLTTVISRSGN